MRQRSDKARRKKIVGRTLLAVVCLLIGIGIYFLIFISRSIRRCQRTSRNTGFFPAYEVVNMNKNSPIEYGGVKRKIVYLTFDDGPSPYQGEFLDVLKQNNVKATFFMVGQNMTPEREANMKRVVEEGHYAGLHSFTHDYKRLYKSGGSANFIEENKKTAALIKR
ncbi:polysaccharide deacetylase family protein [Paenibacillus larvae]|uniref:polysaccharide deacetylase family protein n=1 Tax=Paenibacillus larvae TaxID=1464 RepID=UPI001EEF5DEC|nr:polysaccharide deacetylase family protein [Paenibacillus larvae]